MAEFVGAGRQRQRDDLVAQFDSLDGPRLVVLSGRLGSGKTRVVQEFYRRVSAGQADPPYWPLAIVDPDEAGVDPGVNRKRVAPSGFVPPPEAEIGFLWWAISCEQRQSGGWVPALLVDGEQLVVHTAAIYRRWSQGRRLRRLLKDPATRDRAVAFGGVLGAVAGPLGLLGGAAAVAVSAVLAVPDVRELTEAGIQRWRARRAAGREAVEGRMVDLDAVDRSAEATSLASSLTGAVSGEPSIPTVVVIDDAQWADPSVVLLVRRILEHPTAPILVVATAWPEPLALQQTEGDSEGLAALMADPELADRVSVAVLDDLAAHDLAALVRELGPNTSEPVIAALCAKAKGSPLAMRLLLSQQAVRDAVLDGVIDITVEDVDRLPSEIHALYQALWRELPDPVRKTLAAAAVLDEEFVAPLAVAAATALGVEQAADQLAKAEDPYGWVRHLDDLVLGFTEALRRDVAAEGQLMASHLTAVRSAVLAEAVQRVSSDTTKGPARERTLSTVVSLTTEGFNTDLDAAYLAVSELAALAAIRHEDRSETHYRHLQVTWGRSLHPTTRQHLVDLDALQRSATDVGDLKLANQAANETHQLATQLSHANPDSSQALRDLELSHLGLGALAVIRGEDGTAEHHYLQAMDLAQRLADLQPDSIQALRDLAVNHERLGNLAAERGQGQVAENHYHQAMDLAQRLVDLQPSVHTLRDLATAHVRLGDLAVTRGLGQVAEDHYHQAMDLAQRLVDLQPDSIQALRDLAICHVQLGDLAVTRGLGQVAENHYHQAMDLAQRLVDLQPDSIQALRDLAANHERLGDLAVTRGLGQVAEDHYHQAMDLDQRLVDLQPDSVKALRNLSTSHERLGNLAVTRGLGQVAENHYHQAMDLAQRLVDLQPDSIQALRDLSVSHNKLGNLALAHGQAEVAEEHFRQAMDLRQRAAALQPDSVHPLQDLAISHGELGDLAVARGQGQVAEDHYYQALDFAQRLVDLQPGSVKALRVLATSHGRLGDLAATQGQAEAAEDHYRQAMDLTHRAVALQPDSVQALRDLAICHERLGNLAAERGQTEAAEDHYRQAMDLAQRLVKLQPDSAQALRDLAVNHNKLGNLALAQGRAETADDHYRKAMALRVQLVELQPDSVESLRDLSVSHSKLGDLAMARGEAETADDHYRKAMALRVQLVELQPDSIQALRDLAISHGRLGNLAMAQGQGETAEHHYEQGLQTASATIDGARLTDVLAHLLAYLCQKSVEIDRNEAPIAPTLRDLVLATIHRLIEDGRQVSEAQQEFLERYGPPAS